VWRQGATTLVLCTYLSNASPIGEINATAGRPFNELKQNGRESNKWALLNVATLPRESPHFIEFLSHGCLGYQL
jgi:hypothetical protein